MPGPCMWMYMKEKGIEFDWKKWFEARAKLGFGFGRGRGRGGRGMGWKVLEILENEKNQG